MKIIAVLSNKGGSGKTTLTVNLAGAAIIAKPKKRRKTWILDMDPQASATDWHDSREFAAPQVHSIQAKRLPKTLKKAKAAGVELVLIDTPPHTESAALAAAREADFVLVPCRPSALDLRAISVTIDAIELAGKHKNSAIVINAAPPRGLAAERARAAVADYGIDVAPVDLIQRAALQHSIAAGLAVAEFEPQGKAAGEIQALYSWLMKRVKL